MTSAYHLRTKAPPPYRPQEKRKRGFNEVHMGADYTPQEVEFQLAMHRFKTSRGRPYPTWSEVYAVLLSLGYRQVEEKSPLPPAQERPIRHGPNAIGRH